MGEYDKLYKILDKEYLSLDVLRGLLNNEHVAGVEPQECNDWKYNKYRITLDTQEYYFVYVKKSLSELIKLSLQQNKKTT